jgi:hypothetical protein
MCCLLVSGFLTEITQQIHSLRARGVISSHFARAAGSEMRTFRKSAGTLCTAPCEIAFLVMDFILYRYAIGLRSSRMQGERRACYRSPISVDRILMSAIEHRVPAIGEEIDKSNPNVMLLCELAPKGVDDSKAMQCISIAA